MPGEIVDLKNLSEIPFTDKETVQEHIEDMVTVPLDQGGIDYTSTGGTSGSPLFFYINASRSEIEYAYLVSGWERAGYGFGDALAVFRGRAVGPDHAGLRHKYDPLLRCHYYDAFHMDDDSIERYLDHIQTIGPCYLHAYPSTAAHIARYARDTARPVPPNLKGALLESEIVYPEQVDLIETALGTRWFSSYGHTEKTVAAAACEYSNAYHVWPTYGYLELIDDEGRPITQPGQRGEIVGTGFINDITPFIRYRTGDYATYAGNYCPKCGRHHVLLNDIQGHRTQERLITKSGTPIYWTALNMHDDTFEGVARFQFYQQTPGEAVLRIVPRREFESVELERIKRRLDEKLDGQIDFDILVVDTIAVSPRGKAIYVDQRIGDTGDVSHVYTDAGGQEGRREP